MSVDDCGFDLRGAFAAPALVKEATFWLDASTLAEPVGAKLERWADPRGAAYPVATSYMDCPPQVIEIAEGPLKGRRAVDFHKIHTPEGQVRDKACAGDSAVQRRRRRCPCPFPGVRRQQSMRSICSTAATIAPRSRWSATFAGARTRTVLPPGQLGELDHRFADGHEQPVRGVEFADGKNSNYPPEKFDILLAPRLEKCDNVSALLSWCVMRR